MTVSDPLLIATSLPREVVEKELLAADNPQDSFEILADDFHRANIFFGSPSNDELENLAKLSWLQTDSVDTSRFHGKLGNSTTLSTIHGLFAREVAESTVGALLAFYRQILAARDCQKETKWNRWELRSNSESLLGKSIGILGGGKIAQNVAAMLKPFQCKVTALRREDQPVKKAETISSPEESSIQQVLSTFDVLISTLPLSEETKEWMNALRFSYLKKSCLFMNVGRGGTVDEDALLSALQSRQIAGAILDVTSEEPLPKEHPLWSAPNCYLTQHTFGGEKNEIQKKSRFFAENFRRFRSGLTLVGEA